MHKVYAVSSGEYSDYHINCLFTTRELAVEYQTFLLRTEWERSIAPPSEEIKAHWKKYGYHTMNMEENIKRTEEAGFDKFVEDLYAGPFIEEFEIWDTLPVIK